MVSARAWLMACSCVLFVALGACESDKPSGQGGAAAPTEPLTARESVEGSLSARVKAIDHVQRFVTLVGENGFEESFTVSDAVTRLNEVQVGDTVTVRYKASLLAELRPPTAEEQANPIAAVELGGRGPATDHPAGGVAQVIRVVTTVEAVDVPNMRVTLRGPLNNLTVVKGKKRENLERLRIGDTIVITYTEAMAVSLERAAPAGR